MLELIKISIKIIGLKLELIVLNLIEKVMD